MYIKIIAQVHEEKKSSGNRCISIRCESDVVKFIISYEQQLKIIGIVNNTS